MSSRLCFTIRYLQPCFHGRGDAGRPEWPPSPLRLFQALVAAAAGRWNERVSLNRSIAALHWFEKLPVPEIIAPDGHASRTGYRTYVPDNVGDLVARSWSRGGKARQGSTNGGARGSMGAKRWFIDVSCARCSSRFRPSKRTV